ncbi:MAG: PKD domain-containing protein [Candidatus Bipolaricaulia bacterium]
MVDTIVQIRISNAAGRPIALVFTVLTFLFVISSPVPADTGPPWANSTLDDLSYTEQEGWKNLDAELTVTSDTNDFSGGYVEVELTAGTDSDELKLADGVDLTVSGQEVYMDGDLIGTIDDNYDGSAGRLRINFTDPPLKNSGFESGDLTGWTVNTIWNQMQGQTWAEGPDALGFTADSSPGYDDQSSGSGTASINSGAAYEGNYGLDLEISGGVASGYGTAHAPSVTSSTFAAEAGDTLTVQWKASRTSDYYDVFGFVFVDSDGDGRMANESYQVLFHEAGEDSGGWKTVSASLSIAGNNLRFKFLHGSYDYTNSGDVGSYLYIDGIDLQLAGNTVPTDSVVQTLLEHLMYRNTDNNPDTGKDYEVRFKESDGGTGYNSAQISITRVNDPPAADAGSDTTMSLHEVATLDGTRSTDPDGDSLTFTWSITGNPSEEPNTVTVQENISNSNGATADFFPTSKGTSSQGIYELKLTVSDGQNTDSDTVQVTVTGAPDSIKDNSLASGKVQASGNTSVDFREEANLEVDLQNMDSSVRGLLGGFEYEYANFPDSKKFSGPVLKYADVKAIDFKSGKARISLYYTDREVSKFVEDKLRLYVHDGGEWTEAKNVSVDASQNVIRGEVSVSKLSGSPITASGSQAPSAAFEYLPSEPRIGESINFDGSLSSDPDGSVYTYKWDWNGDGTYDVTTSSTNSTHTYSATGTYSVGLQVVDAGGNTDSTTRDVNVDKYASNSVVTNGPNPVGEEGCIFWIELPGDTNGGTLKIYDVAGKPIYVADLNGGQNRFPSSGRWKPKTDSGNKLGPGIYFYRLRVEDDDGSTWWSEIHKLVVDRSR